MLKKDLMNETYCGWCFFFNKSRNKRAGALLHNPCGFVTDSSPGKGSSAPKTGKKNIHDIITSIYIHLPILKAIDAIEFT